MWHSPIVTPIGAHVSACGDARLCPADAEGHDAMQQARVIEPVMTGCESELLARGDFGIGVGFNEIRRAVGSEAKVDTRVAIEPQCPVDAFRDGLNTGG